MGHLILEEIPIHDDSGSTTHDVKDVTAVQIEMKAVSKVKYKLLFFCRITKQFVKEQGAIRRNPVDLISVKMWSD